MKQLEKNYYKSCKTLPVYNFYEILNSDDLRWLIIDFNENYEDEEFDVDYEVLLKLWNNIHADYSAMFGNSVDTKKYVTIAQITEMETEVYVVEKLFDILSRRVSEKIKEEINAWGYFGDDLEASNKKLDQLRFKISIFKSQNKELIDPEEKEDEKEKKEYDLYKDLVTVEKGLQGSYVIDPKTTVVAKWVRLILTAQNNSKKQKNGK